MVRTKLPRRLGLVGLAIGFGLMAFWQLDYKYNFFHLPTSEEAIAMHRNYSPPGMYTLMEDTVFTLVPGIWIGVFAMDLGDVAGLVVWVIAAILNFPIYYCLGLGISAVWGKIESHRNNASGPPVAPLTA